MRLSFFLWVQVDLEVVVLEGLQVFARTVDREVLGRSELV